MKVGVTTFGCDGGKSGIGQYAVELLRTLPALDADAAYEAFVYANEENLFAPPTGRVDAILFKDSLRAPLKNLAWYQLALPRWCKKRALDVLFLPAANRRVPVAVPCPTVGTVHDFSSIHMQGKYDPFRHFYITRALPFLTRRLTKVITVSECSKKDIVEFARVPEERVVVIHHGVDHDMYTVRDRKAAQSAVRRKYRVPPPYLLYVSRIEHPGKNHVRLVEAFSRLKSTRCIPHTLVLAGSDWSRAEEVYRTSAQSEYKADIIFTGYVPEEDMPDLYCGADLFVFPSLYEGFGMPLLEAMACAVPITCSKVASLPEVVGDAAHLFDPNDEASIAAAIEAMLTDTALRHDYAEKGLKRCKRFTWKAAASRTLEVLEEAAEAGKASMQ